MHLRGRKKKWDLRCRKLWKHRVCWWQIDGSIKLGDQKVLLKNRVSHFLGKSWNKHQIIISRRLLVEWKIQSMIGISLIINEGHRQQSWCKGSIERTPQPDINHTNLSVAVKASRSLHTNDSTARNIMIAAFAVQQKVCVFCHHGDWSHYEAANCTIYLRM